MDSALLVHRIHFAFTITFHYLFPQLTMGLAPLIVVLKTLGLRRNDETYHQAARFWARIFGINFVLGVVTGIPMEFQFGTNWSHFSRFAGGVIGQTLAMEGVFAFFLESAFLGLFLYGEKRLGPRGHWWSAVAVFLGSWLSGFFIIATDAWMQHPVGFVGAEDGCRSDLDPFVTSARPAERSPSLLDQHVHAVVEGLGHAHPAVELKVLLLGRGRCDDGCLGHPPSVYAAVTRALAMSATSSAVRPRRFRWS